MKWRRRKGRDVIDIRGAGKGGGGGPGRGGGLPLPGGLARGGGGIGIVVVIVVIALQVLGGGGGFDLGDAIAPEAGAPGANNPEPIPPGQDPQRELKDFSVYVFEDAQDTWRGIFEAGGEPYRKAELVLYSGAVSTQGCGGATSAVGPFYCPADDRIYLDLSFYRDMERRLDAPGDFAWAYVIAHEMGHHVQDVAGTNEAVRREQESDRDQANELSVRLELQADCYSGVWASTVFAEGDLEQGDLEEAFTATEAVGDDRLQEQAGQEIDLDSFTHGSSEQRRRWFTDGYESGNPDSCDTFSPEDV
jgi:predicted metalloprotease